MRLLFSPLAGLAVVARASAQTVVVTGATGRTGAAAYQLFKQQAGITVRALVRNVTKAQETLGCLLCDVSEGIYVGDIRNEASLLPVMDSADILVITAGTTGSEPPRDILFDGLEKQITAFLSSAGPASIDRHVVLLSRMETPLPETWWSFLKAMCRGTLQVGHYTLDGEALLMNADVPFTIVKACTLDNSPSIQKKLIVGPGGVSAASRTVSRQDVARVLVAAATNPEISTRLRFHICSGDGAPQSDTKEVLRDAMYPWDSRKAGVKAEPIQKLMV